MVSNHPKMRFTYPIYGDQLVNLKVNKIREVYSGTCLHFTRLTYRPSNSRRFVSPCRHPRHRKYFSFQNSSFLNVDQSTLRQSSPQPHTWNFPRIRYWNPHSYILWFSCLVCKSKYINVPHMVRFLWSSCHALLSDIQASSTERQ